MKLKNKIKLNSLSIYVSFYIESARPSKSPDPNAVASPERIARTRTRVSGVSQSQRMFNNFLRKRRAMMNL